MEDPGWSHFVESAFLAVLEAADEGIVVFDREGNCRMVGRRAGELFGLEPANYAGASRMTVLRAMAAACEEPGAFLEAVGPNDLLEPLRVIGQVDVRRPRPRAVLWTSIPVVRDGAPRGRVALLRDITRERSAERSQHQLQTRLNELTPIDTLTGLVNLRRFREELEREHGRSTRAWDSYAVLRLDIDDMHDLNDALGTPIGDKVLEQVAELLTSCRREYDVLGRYEADEFILLLPGADAVAARTVAERMVRLVATHDYRLADSRSVSISAGAAIWVPPSAERGEDIVRRAGVSLMQARAKAQVVVDPGVSP